MTFTPETGEGFTCPGSSGRRFRIVFTDISTTASSLAFSFSLVCFSWCLRSLFLDFSASLLDLPTTISFFFREIFEEELD